MASGYRQFCPVAKASEVFATRWTPLVLRELMSGERTFNDIHRGVPLMSRALLVERLHQLEGHKIIEKTRRADGNGHDYRLTAAGNALRPIVEDLGRWGLAYGCDPLKVDDNDPATLMWTLRHRVDRSSLPDRRVVVRFEFRGVPALRAQTPVWWLILNRSDVSVSPRNPGVPADITIGCDVGTMIAVYLGAVTWREITGETLRIEGSRELADVLPTWLRLDKRIGHDMPVIPPAA
ncbi:MAG TPA: helix-turn-helix domain-containing protein [Xanthobacteraceae bacterium]|jgi:DNA-binding HxlR family transcriptional regulator|nr:helix-turn-helix domain-containing protein [Xanthobacteraceae bacterium]